MGTPGLALPLPKGSGKLLLPSQLHWWEFSTLYGVHKYFLGQVSVSLWPRGHYSSADVEKHFPILTPENAEYQIM